MDEKLKTERGELQAALESVKGGNSEAAVSVLKKEKDAEQLKREKKWEEKRKKYHREIEELKQKLAEKESKIMLGKVDATEEGKLAEKFEVRTPSILLLSIFAMVQIRHFLRLYHQIKTCAASACFVFF